MDARGPGRAPHCVGALTAIQAEMQPRRADERATKNLFIPSQDKEARRYGE